MIEENYHILKLLPQYCSLIDTVTANKYDDEWLLLNTSNIFTENVSFNVESANNENDIDKIDINSWIKYTHKTLSQFDVNNHILSYPLANLINDIWNIEYSMQSTHLNINQSVTIIGKYTIRVVQTDMDWKIQNLHLKILNINVDEK